MDNFLKEVAKKEVGNYHIKMFAHTQDSNAGAAGIFFKNKTEQLHHTGMTSKDFASKLYHSLNTPPKVEQFLRNVKVAMAAKRPEHGLMSAHKSW